jgi:hypothetical protein
MATLTRRTFLARLIGRSRPPVPVAVDRLVAVPEEERMMGWMSLRRILIAAFAASDTARLDRYVSASCREEWGLERLLGVSLPDEKPELEVISILHLGPGAALYTVRERQPSALAECLFPHPSRLEADLQVTGGSDWLLRSLRPV